MGAPQNMSPLAKSVTFKSSRGKAWFCLVFSVAILIMGLLVASVPSQPLMLLSGWICIALGGLGIPVLVAMLVRPIRLILDQDGFTLDGRYRAPRKTAWRDVEEFVVYQLPKGGKVVTYNLAPHVRKNSALARFVREHGGDHCLSNLWPLPIETLAETLNAYRSRALSTPLD